MAASLLSIFLCLLVLIMVVVGIFFGSTLKKIPENEKWVVTRLDKTTVKGPGRFIQIPGMDQVVKVDVSEVPIKVQDQTCITRDMAPVIIHMAIYSHVLDPVKYASQPKRHREDLGLLASSTLKTIVNMRTLNVVLGARESLASAVCDQLNGEIDPALGMKIEKVKILGIVVSKEVLASMPHTIPNIPDKCPNCGAPINRQGANEVEPIKCEYCGFLIKP